MSLAEHYEDKEIANEWIRFGMKLAVQSVLHPFEYSKVLIQVSNSFSDCLPFSARSPSFKGISQPHDNKSEIKQEI